jgi:hypothetical protein
MLKVDRLQIAYERTGSGPLSCDCPVTSEPAAAAATVWAYAAVCMPVPASSAANASAIF